MLVRFSFAVLALAFASTPLAAKENKGPDWDCSIEIADVDESFHVSDNWAFVSLFTERRSQISLAISFYSGADRLAFDEAGVFARALRGRIGFAPPISKAPGWMFAHVGSANGQLPTATLPKEGGFHRGSWYSAADVTPLLAGEEGLVVTFYRQDGQITERTRLSASRIREANARLIELRRKLDERLSDPAKSCIDRNATITILH